MRSSSRLLLAAAATSGACLALVLAVGVCTASCGGGLAAHGHGRRQPRPPSSPVLGVDSLVSAPALQEKGAFAAAAGGDAAAPRDLLGAAAAAAGQDYGFVDPPPDTRRRGGTAPLADHSIVVPVPSLISTTVHCTCMYNRVSTCIPVFLSSRSCVYLVPCIVRANQCNNPRTS